MASCYFSFNYWKTVGIQSPGRHTHCIPVIDQFRKGWQCWTCMQQNSQVRVTLSEYIEIFLWQCYTNAHQPFTHNTLTNFVKQQQICKITCRFNTCKSILSKVLATVSINKARFRSSAELLFWKCQAKNAAKDLLSISHQLIYSCVPWNNHI